MNEKRTIEYSGVSFNHCMSVPRNYWSILSMVVVEFIK